MNDHTLTAEQISAYGRWLREEEHSLGTIENYLRHIRAFAKWLNASPVTKERATGWKVFPSATFLSIGPHRLLGSMQSKCFQFLIISP